MDGTYERLMEAKLNIADPEGLKIFVRAADKLITDVQIRRAEAVRLLDIDSRNRAAIRRFTRRHR